MTHTDRKKPALLTEKEQQDVRANAEAIENLLGSWADRYPLVRKKRIAPVAVLIATVLPALPVDKKCTVGKLILLIFAIDDIADERLVSYDDFLEASKIWEAIARHGSEAVVEHTAKDITGMVVEIRKELDQCALFPELKDLWANQVRNLCKAMAQEYQVGVRYKESGAEAIPELAEYIESGTYSVGFPFWGTSVLVLISAPGTTDHRYWLDEVLRNTGAAIRLYNDVRTYQKEVQESNVNAITIVLNFLQNRSSEKTSQALFEQAQGMVLTMASQYARKAVELVSSSRTSDGQFEAMIRRILEFHAYLYGSQQHNNDYHTISQDDSFALIKNI
jgi:hypothetical protein